MTAVFIGGSRRISRISADVGARLDRIVENRLPIVIGDANGADKAVQSYHDLDHLAGTWSEADYQEFMEALREQRQVDPEMWK